MRIINVNLKEFKTIENIKNRKSLNKNVFQKNIENLISLEKKEIEELLVNKNSQMPKSKNDLQKNERISEKNFLNKEKLENNMKNKCNNKDNKQIILDLSNLIIQNEVVKNENINSEFKKINENVLSELKLVFKSNISKKTNFLNNEYIEKNIKNENIEKKDNFESIENSYLNKNFRNEISNIKNIKNIDNLKDRKILNNTKDEKFLFNLEQIQNEKINESEKLCNFDNNVKFSIKDKSDFISKIKEIIKEAIIFKNTDKEKVIKLQLEPSSLGTINIITKQQEKVIDIVIKISNKETINLFNEYKQNIINDLINTLKNENVNELNIDINGKNFERKFLNSDDNLIDEKEFKIKIDSKNKYILKEFPLMEKNVFFI